MYDLKGPRVVVVSNDYVYPSYGAAESDSESSLFVDRTVKNGHTYMTWTNEGLTRACVIIISVIRYFGRRSLDDIAADGGRVD